QFEKEQQSITSILHEELDDKKLKNNQLHLQKLLNKYNFWISVLGGALLIIAAYLFWKKYKKSPYPAEENVKIIEQNQTAESTDSKTIDNDAVKIEKTETVETESVDEDLTEIPEQQPEEKDVAVLSATDQRLVEGLNSSEQKKGFLAQITLDDLAKQLHTTRSTLSPFLNEHKKGFNAYINSLLIQQAVTDLKAD